MFFNELEEREIHDASRRRRFGANSRAGAWGSDMMRGATAPQHDVAEGCGVGVRQLSISRFFLVVIVLLKNGKLRRSVPAQFKATARNRSDWPKVPV
jgi:hypothetical protein